ncbi:phosphodiesterase/alkaline phosphatase D-like protein [Methanococcus voltae]|uniref:hypothetical protein n=1 Tax=Methanococcus voltae TaxID=2188 RepID=UPI001AE2DE7E|nr:hypothetical protein [Methanococcus voltae]MBP2143772.1 phosphodiesterase/alkaline phosphatase D-like protein [Methanococcus voltae]
MSKFTKITASLLVISICLAGVFANGFDNSNGQRMKTNALQIENCDCTQSGTEGCQNYENNYNHNYNHNYQHKYNLNNANCTCDYNCENRSEFKNNNYQHNYKNNRNQKNNDVGAIESAIGSIF